MSYSDGENSQDVSMSMDMDMEVMEEPAQAHMEGSMSMMGMSFDMEMYSVQEDGAPVVYTGMYDTWTKAAGSEAADTTEFENLVRADDLADKGVELTLSEGTVTFNGREAYEITVVVEGELFAEMMETSMSMMGDMSSLMGDMNYDFSKMSAEMKLLVYADDFSYSQVSMDVAGFEDVMDYSELGAEVTTNEFNVTVSYYSFNDITEIVVPDDVKAAAQESGSSSMETAPVLEGGEVVQDDQGNYVLDGYYEQDDIQVLVTAPEGFTLDAENSENTWLYFDKVSEDPENHQMYIEYSAYILDDVLTESAFSKDHQNDLTTMMGDASYSEVMATGVRKAEAGDYPIKYTLLTYTYGGSLKFREYNCWVIVDENKVVACDVYEISYDGECNMVEDEKAFVSSLFSGVQFR